MPLVLEGGPLHEYVAGHEVYRVGQPVLDTAADLLVDTGYGLILADAQGTVLHLGGDRSLITAAERIGSLPGASWREDIVGNNAIGTALVIKAPVQFRFHEHWCAGWGDWACAAAPVFDSQSGTILAAIGLCTVSYTPDPRMLTMAMRLAQSLERQLMRHGPERHARLKAEAIKLKRWFPQQGVLALDRSGSVAWSAGPMPPGFLEALRHAGPSLPMARVRGEQEVLVAGRYPCLVIPVWDDTDYLGHLLVTAPTAESEGPGATPTTAGHAAKPLQRIIAATNERLLVFTPDEVFAVRTVGGRIWVLTDSGEWPTPYDSISEIKARLPEQGFFQVDRGCLVNLSHIKEIHPMFNRTAILVMADRKRTQIPVSRRRTARLRLLLKF